jgi:hypothetical protein
MSVDNFLTGLPNLVMNMQENRRQQNQDARLQNQLEREIAEYNYNKAQKEKGEDLLNYFNTYTAEGFDYDNLYSDNFHLTFGNTLNSANPGASWQKYHSKAQSRGVNPNRNQFMTEWSSNAVKYVNIQMEKFNHLRNQIKTERGLDDKQADLFMQQNYNANRLLSDARAIYASANVEFPLGAMNYEPRATTEDDRGYFSQMWHGTPDYTIAGRADDPSTPNVDESTPDEVFKGEGGLKQYTPELAAATGVAGAYGSTVMAGKYDVGYKDFLTEVEKDWKKSGNHKEFLETYGEKKSSQGGNPRLKKTKFKPSDKIIELAKSKGWKATGAASLGTAGAALGGGLLVGEILEAGGGAAGRLFGGKDSKSERLGRELGSLGTMPATAATGNALKNVFNVIKKKGLGWAIKKVAKDGGLGLAFRTIGKGGLGAVGSAYSGGALSAISYGWLAKDLYDIANILTEDAGGSVVHGGKKQSTHQGSMRQVKKPI